MLHFSHCLKAGILLTQINNNESIKKFKINDKNRKVYACKRAFFKLALKLNGCVPEQRKQLLFQA